ncbi:MAG: fumarylacetoacetate hydrolase family protein [Candidatus Didemnitutus sp.]|nr:fumarylacetoacetate hydrolase family protein [Candidatus Didemnitutus sp.]
MKLHRATNGLFLENQGQWSRLSVDSIDAVFSATDLPALLARAERLSAPPFFTPLAPLGAQEVWAAGVTYFRSRNARIEESKQAGGGDFYQRVYEADRPELFFKATPQRTVGPRQQVRIRADAKWNVPEPELTLAVNRAGKIFGYTIGNDMSSRDIEAENPLYLPQAKVYQGCAAIGPSILLSDAPLPPETTIELKISRASAVAFTGETRIDQIKRSLPSLVEYLFRDQEFPHGCLLMTGTGIVPPDSFTLQPGDEISIRIAPIGELVTTVASLK